MQIVHGQAFKIVHQQPKENHKLEENLEKNNESSIEINENHPYKCPICKDTFPSNTQLGKHSNQIHKIPHFRQRKKGQTGICSICDASYPKQSELNRHIRRVHEGKKLPYECTDCEFDTLQEKLLEKHMLTCKGENSIIDDTNLFNDDFEVINESDQEKDEIDQENIEIDQKNQEIDQENQGIDQDIEDIPIPFLS